jgi:hypothetical protein
MIYLLFCTIRPDVFKITHKEWMDKCDDKNNVVTKVVVSSEKDKKCLPYYDVLVSKYDKIGVCHPSYMLTKSLNVQDEDIVILASDDFFPCDGWDSYLINIFSTFNGCLFVDDGYQDGNFPKECLSITIPIMSGHCLKILNMAMYHPSYIHFFGDTELYRNVRDLCLLKDVRHSDGVVFEHRHHVFGKRKRDDIDDILAKTWNVDKTNFDSRQNLHVSERIKI